ncbi:hypothetical protein GCM10027093_69810 [Paraburkholderia jirisanensis]
MKVRSSQLTGHLTACAPTCLPVPITVSPGIATSIIVNQMTAAPGHDLLIHHPVVEDPADLNGLPFPTTDGAAKHLPISDLERAVHGTDLPVRLPDDPGQVSPATRAAGMQLQPGRRRTGNLALPDHATFFAATTSLHIDIVVGCIDSPRAKHAIAKAAQADSRRYYLDCGNGAVRGQVVSGESGRSRCDRRPDEGGMSSERLAPQHDKDEGAPACFMAGALSPRSLVINETIVVRTFNLLSTLFRTGTPSYPVLFVNLAAGRTKPVPTGAAARARSGHEALRAKGPGNAQEGGRA